MGDDLHLSNLVLDELLAELPIPPDATAHLGGCDACQKRLEVLRASREAVLRTLALEQPAPAAPPAPTPLSRRRWLHVVAVALPLAAAALLLVLTPIRPGGDTRLKGSANVELLDPDGHAVTKARVGDTLELAVGSGGLGYGLVMALDGRGMTTLWPAEGGAMAAVEPGARVRLSSFTVTPGDVRVVAVFSKQRLSLGQVTQPMVQALSQGFANHQTPLTVELPVLGDAMATVRLEVVP